MSTFNMKSLSDAVAERFSVSKQEGAEITRFVFDSVKKNLIEGKQVRLHKFGTLEARKRAAGVARNLSTGDRIEVPSRRVVKLTVSPVFKSEMHKAAN